MQKPKKGFIILSFRIKPEHRKKYTTAVRKMMAKDGYIMRPTRYDSKP